MNVLIVGADSRGSWQMRGVQLGGAIGASVTLKPTAADWSWADVVVLVKRAAMVYAKQASKLKVPVIWDALDFWKQPEDNGKPIEWHIAEANRIKEQAGVSLVIGATQAMARDLGGLDGFCLPHHARIGLKPAPIRAKAEVVAYEGKKKYLGRWFKALEHACSSLGLRFIVNPDDIRQADVLVSFRDGRWDGDVCRRWKSGIKIVNAIVAGRPIVTQPCASRDELLPSPEEPIENTWDLADSIRSSSQIRSYCYEAGLQSGAEFALQNVAEQYRGILRKVAERKAA